MSLSENPGTPTGILGSIRGFFSSVGNMVKMLSGQFKKTGTFLLEKLQEFPKYVAQYLSVSTQPIKNPKTAADFKKNLDIIIHESKIGKHFAAKPQFLQKIAERAAELKNDPNNPLNSPEQITDLMRLAVYQLVLYCDDSASMASNSLIPGCDRSQAMRTLATRIASVATKALPPKTDKGVHLRFINSNEVYDDLKAGDIEDVAFQATNSTPLGTNLKEKVLKPLVYNVVDNDQKLPHPLLILTITDGCPDDGDNFRNEIAACSQYLINNKYPKEAVSFDVSQVGNDPGASRFLEGLMKDEGIKDVLHCTAEHLDEQFQNLRDNDANLDGWLLQMLSKKIKMES